jgi:hypothetical protein
LIQDKQFLEIAEKLYEIMIHPLKNIEELDKDLIASLEANSKAI